MHPRYERQFKLPQIGPEGQKKIGAASAAVVGIGALGSVSVNLLARAGVGRLRLIDRDFLELQNLQRQVLYDEEDLTSGFPKAVAAQRKLQKINSQITIEAEPSDVNPETIEELLEGIDLVIDGTDNFETRFLLNDFSLREKKPWIYGAAVGTGGLAYVILPGRGPCLRCLFEVPPAPGTFATCETAGILAPAAHLVASFQATEALKILSGRMEAVDRRLWKLDCWKNEFKAMNVTSHPAPLPKGEREKSKAPGTFGDYSLSPGGGEGGGEGEGCSGCTRQEFPFLSRTEGSRTVKLCGRNAVQIYPQTRADSQRHPAGAPLPLNFSDLAQRLSPLGRVQYNEYLLKASIEPFEITVFQNGRAIIQGTEDAGQARSIYAKYIGG